MALRDGFYPLERELEKEKKRVQEQISCGSGRHTGEVMMYSMKRKVKS